MVSPEWQTMWVESQHCSKNLVNVSLPSQQAQKVLEDLKTSCYSPNKAVQLEALKCWGLWIHNQNPEDWKLNSVCFSAVRPLITKKLQPLHKDVDICKLKLSLMWALLTKVQDMMHLEGPQYILEVFLQGCLTWLSSTNGDDSENEVSHLILQLLLAVFDKNESLVDCDTEVFPPLSSNVLRIGKVFQVLADKFSNIFIHWRKVKDKSVILKIWKHFLEHCELSCKQILIPVWHKIFKLVGQICSEKDEPVKERLAFLHGCATTLKSALSSSKFIDFGNLLTTPCEVLLKKLLELCSVECDEFRDSEMFWQSKEICQALSDESVSIGGYDLCIGVLDVLEEFCLRSLFWGVWCGLVHCYNARLKDTHRSQLTKIELKFYRKLRGVAINFELDKNQLHEACITEVEKHIGSLNINCLRLSHSAPCRSEQEPEVELENFVPECNVLDRIVPEYAAGKFSLVPFNRKKVFVFKPLKFNFDLIKNGFNTLSLNSKKSLVSYMAGFRFISMRIADRGETGNSLEVKVEVSKKEEISLTVSCRGAKGSPLKLPPCPVVKKKKVVACEAGRGESESEEEVVATPTTRSRKRAEEEKKKEENMGRRRKRKSFEVLVQEIVKKNKERKTEKNSKKRKTSDSLKNKRRKNKTEVQTNKKPEVTNNERVRNKKPLQILDRKLRQFRKEEATKNQNKKNKKPDKLDGKLENYFKVVPKKSENDAKKEIKKPSRTEKKKISKETKRCSSAKEKKQKKGEVSWKQTSLKAMMDPKNKAGKAKHGARTREKTAEATEEKPKLKNDRKLLSSPIVNFSPFKEVFHDHEYAKMEPAKMETIEKILNNKKEKARLSKTREKTGKLDLEKKLRSKPADVPEKDDLGMKTAEGKNSKVEESETVQEAPKLQEKPETEKTEVPKPAEPEESKMEDEKEPEIVVLSPPKETFEKPLKPFSELNDKNVEVHSPKNNDENREEILENDSTPEKKSRKRIRMSDCLKPNKRIKLEESMEEDLLEEKLPLEVTEKENLEKSQQDFISPTKTEKSNLMVKNGSPMTGGGGMSRALRIIGLVPESTMARSWETSPKVEALKCKKAPNVDKNSRASKMLALLLGNIVEEEDVINLEEDNYNSGVVVTTPNSKTPLSSLKSPNSIKKRKSIRFDDARNETVLYQIDTPPSQILEEKEKRKGTRPFEIALNLP